MDTWHHPIHPVLDQPLAHGLALDDPLQPIADQLDPEVMELIVAAVAEGVKDLSAKAVDKDNPNFSKLDKELHVAAVAVEVAVKGSLSATSVGQEAIAGWLFTSTECTTIKNTRGGAGGIATARGTCSFTFPTSKVCVTHSPNGTMTTTTTPGTMTCECPMPASGICQAWPSCVGCP